MDGHRRTLADIGVDAHEYVFLPAASASSDLVDVKTAAEICYVSDRTIRWRLRQHIMRGVRLRGMWLIPVSELDRIMRATRVHPYERVVDAGASNRRAAGT
jgi:Helix-turn-helix domain